MERYDLDTEIHEGIVTTSLYKRKHGDWVRYEDYLGTEDSLSEALRRIEELEEDLYEERALVERLEAELTEYENPI